LDESKYIMYCPKPACKFNIGVDRPRPVECINSLCRIWQHEVCQEGQDLDYFFCSRCRNGMASKRFETMRDRFRWIHTLEDDDRLKVRHKVWKAIVKNDVEKFCKLLLEKRYDEKFVDELAFSKKDGKRILQHLLALPDNKMLNEYAKAMPYLLACDLFWSKPLGRSLANAVMYCLERDAVSKCKGLLNIVKALGKPEGCRQLPRHLQPNYWSNAINCIEKKAYKGLEYCLKKFPMAVTKRDSENRTMAMVAARNDDAIAAEMILNVFDDDEVDIKTEPLQYLKWHDNDYFNVFHHAASSSGAKVIKLFISRFSASGEELRKCATFKDLRPLKESRVDPLRVAKRNGNSAAAEVLSQF